MPKYRLLTTDELEGLEKEFIDYLIVNGIDADEWTSIKSDNPQKANQIIDLFSDVVLEGVLRKIEFLEYRSPKQLFIFECGAQKMTLRGLQALPDSSIDFTQELDHLKVMKYVKVIRTEKAYSPNREQELFSMTQRGCMITDGTLFEQLGSD